MTSLANSFIVARDTGCEVAHDTGCEGLGPHGDEMTVHNKVESLQALRFVAALIVVLFHAHLSVMATGAAPALFGLFANGELGVDIFFVISGFVIYVSATRRPDFSAAGFLFDRFWRIYPIYWVVLSAQFASEALSLATGLGNVRPEAFETGPIAASLLLLPVTKSWMVLDVAWTLTLEVTFYLIFALSYVRGGHRAALICVSAWFLAGGLWRGLAGSTEAPLLLANEKVLEFAFGLIVARLFVQGRMPYARLALGVGALGLAGVLFALPYPAFRAAPQWLVAGLPAACLVYGLAARPVTMPRWLLLAGEASYSLYLIHFLLIGLIASVSQKLLGVHPMASLFTGLPVIAALILSSIALTVWVERPILRWGRRRRRRPAAVS